MKFFRGLMVGGMLSVLFLVGGALASPFMVSDPNPTAVGGYSEITGAPWAPSPVNTQADGAIKVDLVSAPVGTTQIQIRVCVPEWEGLPETVCSPFVDFQLRRRGPPSAAGGIGLTK